MYLIVKDFVLLTLMASFVINGLLILSDKFEALQWLIQRTKNDFLARMLSCDFCLSHHVTLLALLAFVFPYEFEYAYLLIPISVAGLINLMR